MKPEKKKTDFWKKVILFILVISFFVVIVKSSKAGFSVSYDCFGDYCYEGRAMVWKVNISNEGLTPLNIESIMITDINDNIIAETQGSLVETDTVKKFIIRSDVPKPNNFTTFYFKPCFRIKTNETESFVKCYDLMNLSVMPYPVVKCNNDSDCEENRYCNNGLCFNLSCDYCQHIVNHSCVSYECCKNYDCKEDESCVNHSCVFLNCAWDEGFIKHKCVKLNCGLFKEPRMHKCVYRGWANFVIKISPSIVIIVILFLLLFRIKIKGRTLIESYNMWRDISYNKRMEIKHIRQAEVHRKLINYLRSREQIEKHKRLLRFHEREAEKYRKRWQKYFKNFEVCPVCGREVPKGYEFCPYCGARLS